MLHALLPHLRREAAHLRVVQAVGDFCRECRLKAKQLLVGEAVGQHSGPDGRRALVNGGAACMWCSHSQERRQRQQGVMGVERHGQLRREGTGEWASTDRECGAMGGPGGGGGSGHRRERPHPRSGRSKLAGRLFMHSQPGSAPSWPALASPRALGGRFRTLCSFLVGSVINCDRASPGSEKETLGEERTSTALGTQLSTSTEDAIAAALQLRNTGECETMERKGQPQA